MKRSIKTVFILIFLIILAGCNSGDKNDTSKQQEAPEIEEYVISDIGKEIHQVEIGRSNQLWGAPIANDGTILIQDSSTSELKTTLYLLDVETGDKEEIDNCTYEYIEGQEVFKFSYQDDDMIVYFNYKLQSQWETPIKYYIYHKNTKLIETIDYQDEIDISHSNNTIPSWEVARIDQDLFFTVSDSENYNSIYKYNLDTKKIDLAIEGGEKPSNYNDELVYINQDKSIVSMDGTILSQNVENYFVSNETLAVVKKENDEYTFYQMKGDVETLLFTKPSDELIHEISTDGKYISWHHNTESSYIFDITENKFVLIDEPENASQEVVSNNYIYWSKSVSDPQDKDGGTTTLYYINLSE